MAQTAGKLHNYPRKCVDQTADPISLPQYETKVMIQNQRLSCCRLKRERICRKTSRSRLKITSREEASCHQEFCSMPLVRYLCPIELANLHHQGKATSIHSVRDAIELNKLTTSKKNDASEDEIHPLKVSRIDGRLSDTDDSTSKQDAQSDAQSCECLIEWNRIGFASTELNKISEESNKEGDIKIHKKLTQPLPQLAKNNVPSSSGSDEKLDYKWKWHEKPSDGLSHRAKGSIEQLRKTGCLSQRNLKIRMGRQFNPWLQKLYDVLAEHVTLFHANIDLLYPMYNLPYSVPIVQKEIGLRVFDDGTIECMTKLIWVMKAHLIHTIWSRLWIFTLKVGPRLGLVNVAPSDIRKGSIDIIQKTSHTEQDKSTNVPFVKWILTEADIYPFLSNYRRVGVPYSLIFSQKVTGNLHKVLKGAAKQMNLHYDYHETELDKFSVVTCKLTKSSALEYYRRKGVLETNWYVIVPPD